LPLPPGIAQGLRQLQAQGALPPGQGALGGRRQCLGAAAFARQPERDGHADIDLAGTLVAIETVAAQPQLQTAGRRSTDRRQQTGR
jgi:hypothetical protein